MVSVESFSGRVSSRDHLPPHSVAPPHSITGPETGNLSVVVSREVGAVVVTVEGRLDVAGCAVLEALLTDLIDGQGNITVVIDLGRTIIEQEALVVLDEAARRARGHGAKLSLRTPWPHTQEAQLAGFLTDGDEVPAAAGSASPP